MQAARRVLARPNLLRRQRRGRPPRKVEQTGLMQLLTTRTLKLILMTQVWMVMPLHAFPAALVCHIWAQDAQPKGIGTLTDDQDIAVMALASGAQHPLQHALCLCRSFRLKLHAENHHQRA